jgi:protein arginine kinase activator
MICQECQERPATLHYSKIVNGEKTDIHLCENCANDSNNKYIFSQIGGYSVNDLLAGLLKGNTGIYEMKKNKVHQDQKLECPRCRMTFHQFTKIGRLGCSTCYETFMDQMKPIVKRIHSGNVSHTGKLPQKINGSISLKRKLNDLKVQMQSFIESENFEQAIKIRDEIRTIEKDLQILQKEGE